MISKNLEVNVGNIIWIVGVIFTMGVAYSQIGQLEEDIKVLSTLENIQLYKPKKPTNKLYKEFLYNEKPSYLNLKR